MEMNFKYFQNSDCEHFPCHIVDDPVNFNCLFCYCPMYRDDDCPGDPDFSNGIKDCSYCDYPHKAENYDNIVDYLMKKTVERKEERVFTGYTGGYIPSTDLTQDDIDKIKKMIDRLNSTESEE